MSWGIAANWLAVLGLALLTFGTGTQALANLAEFKSLRAAISEEAIEAATQAARDWISSPRRLPVVPEAWNQRLIMWKLRLFSNVYARQTILGAIFIMPSSLIRLYLKGGEEAFQLARFLRLVQVWGILMIGSALALAAACIQLALA